MTDAYSLQYCAAYSCMKQCIYNNNINNVQNEVYITIKSLQQMPLVNYCENGGWSETLFFC